jgi:hypothetical protein
MLAIRTHCCWAWAVLHLRQKCWRKLLAPQIWKRNLGWIWRYSIRPIPPRCELRQIALHVEQTLYIVSSKSGTTSEVHAFLNYFWALAEEKLGKKAGEHFIAITDPGTSLEALAHERGFRHVFNADPTVGGRNSALISFGLVPAALIGLDVERFLNQARAYGQPVPASRSHWSKSRIGAGGGTWRSSPTWS